MTEAKSPSAQAGLAAEAADLDHVGAPTLTHIAACLRDLHTELQAAIDAGDLGAICNAADRLGWLWAAVASAEAGRSYREEWLFPAELGTGNAPGGWLPRADGPLD